ncbi:MAG: hypothetical protein SH817_08580 [Leptospira sp.]|nr:hypothetical protein [Leptospira sp.]
MLHRIREILNEDGSIQSSDRSKISYNRMQTSSKVKQNGQGNQVFAKYKFFFRAKVDLKETDKIEFLGKKYSIMEFYPVMNDRNQVDHIEVWV